MRVPARRHTSPLGLHRAPLDTACARPLPPEAEEGWFGGLLDHVASLFEGLPLARLAAAVTSHAKLGLLLLHSPALQSLLLVPRHSARGWAWGLGAGCLSLELLSAFTVPELQVLIQELGGHRWWRFRLRWSYSLPLFFSAYKSNTKKKKKKVIPAYVYYRSTVKHTK